MPKPTTSKESRDFFDMETVNEFLIRLAENGCGNAYVVLVSKIARDISVGIDDFTIEVPALVSGLDCDLFIYFMKVRSVVRWLSGIPSLPDTYQIKCDKYKWFYSVKWKNCNLVDSRAALSEYLNWKMTQEFGSVSQGLLDTVDLNLSVRGVMR